MMALISRSRNTINGDGKSRRRIRYLGLTLSFSKTLLKSSMLVSWVVTTCGVVGRYQRFRGTDCLHLQNWSVTSSGLVDNCQRFAEPKASTIRRYNPEDQHRLSSQWELQISTGKAIRKFGPQTLENPGFRARLWEKHIIARATWD